jgi:RNA polymerase-binding protein DksA
MSNKDNAFHSKDTSEMKTILLAKKASIISRLDSLMKDKMRRDVPLEKSHEDQAMSLENDEVVDALDEHSRKELSLIDVTLRKIDLGEYGICSHCQGPIGFQRLKALPYAIKCIQCAQ